MNKKTSTILHTAIATFTYILISIANVFAVRADIPWGDSILVNKDVNIPNKISSGVIWNQDDIINLIKLINNYLWLSLWTVCLAITIYGGFILITAQWEKAKMQKANQMIIWSAIGLVICVMAYVIVRVVVNLF